VFFRQGWRNYLDNKELSRLVGIPKFCICGQRPRYVNPKIRRFDIEIGLYYNRARYYNPFMGRFLRPDPIGYGDGMNNGLLENDV